MPSIDDYHLRADGEGPPPPDETSRSGLWIVVAVLLVIAAIVAAVVVFRPSVEPDEGTTASTEPAASPVQDERLPPLGTEGDAVDLPPLDLTDPVVRQILSALSSRPEMVRWLATDNLLRGGVAAIDNVARGRTPATHFRAVAPGEKFSTGGTPGQLTTSPRAHARYDGIAETVASLDADGISKAYATLRPRMIEAYRELGYPEGDVDAAVQRAIVHLLQTPEIAPDAAVEPAALQYKYSDPRIEGLSGAQKQLLRMGPENVRRIKAKLREIAVALGIPQERLPPG
jgi:hypothetical protein